MSAQITEDLFLEMVRSFRESAFRLETRDSYALGYERTDFEHFLAGSPTPPPELDWWRPWLDRVTRWRQEGKTIGRVRVLADPPTGYQRWMLWADRWAREAGEDIRYIPRGKANEIGLPAVDWWLLDDEQAIIMAFDDDGRPGQKTLVTEPDLIARYRRWRDLAVRHATLAEHIAAA